MRDASLSVTNVSVRFEYSAMPPRGFDVCRKALLSGTENATLSWPGPSADCRRYMRRSPSRCGSGLSITPRTTLKIAVFAPIPRARVRITAAEKPRARVRLRKEYRKSLIISGRQVDGLGGWRSTCHNYTSNGRARNRHRPAVLVNHDFSTGCNRL